MDVRTVSMMFMAVTFPLLSNGVSAQLPYIPCPNNFRYEYTGSNYIGVITLFYIGYDPMTVKIEMQQSEVLNSNYNGKISLLSIKANGIFTYRVDFPILNVVPRVTEISLNNVKLCSGQKDSSSGATFHLTHIIKWYDIGTPRIPQSLPVRTVQSTAEPLPIPSESTNFNEINSVCGRKSNVESTNLVIHGQDIAESRFPWIVAIFLWNMSTSMWDYTCGGSLISTRTVVTAAHCLYNRNSQLIPFSTVILSMGRNSLIQWQNGVNMYLERIIIHPDYKTDQYDADIAILHLNQNVRFSTSIQPICLWQGSSDIIEGSMGIVVSWGKDETNTGPTNVPKLANMRIVSELTCRRSDFRMHYMVSNRTLCAGMRDGSGPCNGDSGSGLMIHNGQKWMLRGIVSRALLSNERNCDLEQYISYCDAAKFTDWIKSSMLV